MREFWRILRGPRVVLGTLWAGFVAWGGWWLSCQPPKTDTPKPERFLAAHAMPTNYRLGKPDLTAADAAQTQTTLPQYLGRHLARNVAAGDTVTIADLRAKPVISAVAERDILPFSIEGRPDLIDTLNTGSKVDLYQNMQAVLKQIPVLAIQCDPPASTSCRAILGIKESEKSSLSKAELAKIIIIQKQP